MAINLDGSSGIDSPALTLDTPLADAEGGTGQVTAVPFKKGFTSAEQTITASGSLTIAHGLGASPSLVQARLICKTAELGYSIDDEVIVTIETNSTTLGGYGASIVPDATNISIRFGSQTGSFLITRKDNGNNAVITAANWKLIVRAWA